VTGFAESYSAYLKLVTMIGEMYNYIRIKKLADNEFLSQLNEIKGDAHELFLFAARQPEVEWVK